MLNYTEYHKQTPPLLRTYQPAILKLVSSKPTNNRRYEGPQQHRNNLRQQIISEGASDDIQ